MSEDVTEGVTRSGRARWLALAGAVIVLVVVTSLVLASGSKGAQSSGSSSAASLFKPQTTSDTGISPTGITVARLTKNGPLDVITANRDGGSLSFFYGNGNGTFSKKHDMPVPGIPFDVQVADVNGDGIPDLIVANTAASGPEQNAVMVYPGRGDGTFGTPAIYRVGQNPTGVEVADLLHNGKLDIITADFSGTDQGGGNGGAVSVLINKGNGTFKPAATYPTGQKARNVAIGDLAGNGKLDLVSANADGDSISVLMGRGDGTFLPARTFSAGAGSRPRDVVIGDFGNGKQDIAVAGLNKGLIIFPGNGDGTFGKPVDYKVGNNPTAVIAGHFFPGSKHLDLAVADLGSLEVSLVPGNGNGTFGDPVNVSTGLDPLDIAVADINGDGIPSILIANAGDSTVSVLLSHPAAAK